MVGKDLIMATLLGSGGGSSGGGGTGGVIVTHGSYTPTEEIALKNDTANVEIPHGLGVIPDLFILMGTKDNKNGQPNELDIFMYNKNGFAGVSENKHYACRYGSSVNSWRQVGISSVPMAGQPNADTMPIAIYPVENIAAKLYPAEYRWIAIGGLSE